MWWEVFNIPPELVKYRSQVEREKLSSYIVILTATIKKLYKEIQSKFIENLKGISQKIQIIQKKASKEKRRNEKERKQNTKGKMVDLHRNIKNNYMKYK